VVPIDAISEVLLLNLDLLSPFEVVKFMPAACIWLEPRLVAALSPLRNTFSSQYAS